MQLTLLVIIFGLAGVARATSVNVEDDHGDDHGGDTWQIPSIPDLNGKPAVCLVMHPAPPLCDVDPGTILLGVSKKPKFETENEEEFWKTKFGTKTET